MQIFELYFNPKIKEEQIFDSFIFEPENIYERKLGSLYMVGELQNSLPQNLNFLDNLAKIIKKNYYTLSLQSPEKALSQGLKRVNDFLTEEVKKDNVSWLGNLNFAVLSLKDLNLIFIKTGNLKILLIRGGQINDIGKGLELQEFEPYPLKIFLNVVTGKLALNDIILVLTKEIFDFFQQQNILTKIALAENINSNTIKELLPAPLFTKGEGKNISGICFLAVIKSDLKTVIKQKEILFKKEKLSLFNIFSPFQRITKTIKNPLENLKNQFLKIFYPIKKSRKFIAGFKRVNFPKKFISKILKKELKRKLILILILILFLLLGSLIF